MTLGQIEERGRYPTPGYFLAKSAEMFERKRVEFFAGAKKRKRVRKNMKRKSLNPNESGRVFFECDWEFSIPTRAGTFRIGNC
jgi:hypothetical protein